MHAPVQHHVLRLEVPENDIQLLVQVLQGEQDLGEQPPGQGLLQARAPPAHHQLVEIAIRAELHDESQLVNGRPEGAEQLHDEGVARSLEHLALLPRADHHVLHSVLLAVQNLQCAASLHGLAPELALAHVPGLVDCAEVALADQPHDLEAVQQAGARLWPPQPRSPSHLRGQGPGLPARPRQRQPVEGPRPRQRHEGREAGGLWRSGSLQACPARCRANHAVCAAGAGAGHGTY
mmetsp:Transcript_2940/g.9106  ORF Transcript_2940/g.9106 Transcript_2940/m.9106 type:complete len:235 (-) Transcript_2940:525-1229(-)